MFFLLLVLNTVAHAQEPCEHEARKFSQQIAHDSQSLMIEPVRLVWFSETVSYGFKIKGLDQKLRTYLVKYSIVLTGSHDDLSKPDACRLMISGEINQVGEFIFSKY